MERGSSVHESAHPSDADDDEDDDIDIPIYESSGSDQSFVDENGDENDGDDDKSIIASAQPAARPHPALRSSSPTWQMRDVPWPSIQDHGDTHHSDGENVDPNVMDVEHETDNSSQPSEYPSTQKAWPGQPEDASSEFSIHQDEDH